MTIRDHTAFGILAPDNQYTDFIDLQPIILVTVIAPAPDRLANMRRLNRARALKSRYVGFDLVAQPRSAIRAGGGLQQCCRQRDPAGWYRQRQSVRPPSCCIAATQYIRPDLSPTLADSHRE